MRNVSSWRHVRINRNILECKGYCLSSFSSVNSVLIETYWNVKHGYVKSKRNGRRINRNILECKGGFINCETIRSNSINRNILECKENFVKRTKTVIIVLIETYWNVKCVVLLVFTHDDSCINRNILECKGCSGARACLSTRVLIETYWNVKDSAAGVTSCNTSINRNILECKGHSGTLEYEWGDEY